MPREPREFVIIQKSESAPPTRWDSIERISKVFSIAAIPLAIALGGWWIQQKIGEQNVKSEFVQLAVSILKEPADSKIQPELRDWAAELLAANSPTRVDSAVIRKLKSGEATLPASAGEPGRYMPGVRPLETLQPVAAEVAKRLIARARAEGIEVAVVRTLVTNEEQDSIYALGRTRPGSVVTFAKGGSTAHNLGLAFDLVPVVNGEITWGDLDSFKKVGAIGRELGLVWGGDYRHIKDYPHFEVRRTNP